MFKVNNRSTRTRCEICSNLTIKTPERRQYFTTCSSVSIINFEHVIAGWECPLSRVYSLIYPLSHSLFRNWFENYLFRNWFENYWSKISFVQFIAIQVFSLEYTVNYTSRARNIGKILFKLCVFCKQNISIILKIKPFDYDHFVS